MEAGRPKVSSIEDPGEAACIGTNWGWGWAVVLAPFAPSVSARTPRATNTGEIIVGVKAERETGTTERVCPW